MSLRTQIADLLTKHRLPLSDEKILQAEMAAVFEAAGIGFRREVRLGDGDIVDFMVGGCAVEVKIKGGKRSIYRQCERYCGHPEVSELVLATNVPMSLPAEICGKPVAVALLGLGWL